RAGRAAPGGRGAVRFARGRREAADGSARPHREGDGGRDVSSGSGGAAASDYGRPHAAGPAASRPAFTRDGRRDRGPRLPLEARPSRGAGRSTGGKPAPLL